MSSLADLVRQSANLRQGLPHDGNGAVGGNGGSTDMLPDINLGLDQILEGSAKLLNINAGQRGMSGDGRVGGGLLGRSTAGGQSSSDIGSAHYLLATQGVNAPNLSSHINHINSFAAASSPQQQPSQPPSSSGAAHAGAQWEPTIPLSDTDVDGYLSIRKEMTIISAIEETRKKTQEDSRRERRSKMKEEWSGLRRRILEEMGGEAGQASSSSSSSSSTGASAFAGRSNLGASRFGLGSTYGSLGASTATYGAGSVNGAGVGGGVDAIEVQRRMMQYDEIVKRLNARRKTQSPFALVNVINAVMAKNDEKHALLSSSLDLLSSIIGEDSATSTGDFLGSSVVTERQYAAGYFSAEGSEAKAKVNRTIIDGGRRYLEREFKKMVEKTLAERQAEAKLGGAPTMTNKLRAYSELVLKNHPLKEQFERVNSSVFWAQIYFLLRAGSLDEAVALAESTEFAMPKNDKTFVTWIKLWRQSDQRLPRDQRDRFLSEYNKRIRHTAEKGDPFKYALWKIIGRVELNKKNVPGVTVHLEDWMWLQLSLVKESSAGSGVEASSEKYNLQDLGNVVLKYGESYFDPQGTRPLVYLQYLLFAGQFERATEFLLSKPRYEVDGVHVAIALTYYGLLRVPASKDFGDGSTLSPSPTPTSSEPTVDFARIIQRYIRGFFKSDASAALQYAYLISLNAKLPEPIGSQQREQCWNTVCNIILESKNYSLVLGIKTPEGQVLPSLVARDIDLVNVRDKQAALQDLVSRVSAKAPADMPISDRIELYKSAGQHELIMQTLNQALSDSLDAQLTPAELEQPDELVEYVKETRAELETDRIHVDTVACMTSDVLIGLKQAKRMYEKTEFAKTLEILQNINIIPLDSDVPGITRAAENFKDVDETITRKIDRVLMMAMRSLFELHQAQKKTTYGGASRLENLQTLRRKSRALMMFAGMMRYTMSNETYTQLVHLDAFF